MSIKYITIEQDTHGQRLDNFLIKELKGVPKSRIYRAIRKGEVRINKSRAKAEKRLATGDVVRIPPIRTAAANSLPRVLPRMQNLLESRILAEDGNMIVLNKPSGVPVHGGSDVNLGLIEALRQMRPHCSFLELVHRLDRGTSGCLMIAKKRSVLTRLQTWLTSKQMKKRYWVLVQGHWDLGQYRCDLSLIKNQLASGERMVRVARAGKAATTIFKPLRFYSNATLLEATLKTGRTHQIRVHLQHLGYALAGDDKYGEREFNQAMHKLGLKRMFLQAMELSYQDHESIFGICASLDPELVALLLRLQPIDRC